MHAGPVRFVARAQHAANHPHPAVEMDGPADLADLNSRARDRGGRARKGVVDAVAGDAAADDQAEGVDAGPESPEVDVPPGGADLQGRRGAECGYRSRRLGRVDDPVAVGVGGGVGGDRRGGRRADEDAAKDVGAHLHGGAGQLNVLGKQLGDRRRIAGPGGEPVAGGRDGAVDGEPSADVAADVDADGARAGRGHAAGEHGLAGDAARYAVPNAVVAEDVDASAVGHITLDRRLQRDAEGVVALDGHRSIRVGRYVPDESGRAGEPHAVAAGSLGEGAVDDAVVVGVRRGIALGDRD